MFISGLLQGLKDIGISKRLYTSIGSIILCVVLGVCMLIFPTGAFSIAIVVVFTLAGLFAALSILSVIAALKTGFEQVALRMQFIKEKEESGPQDIHSKNEFSMLTSNFNQLADQFAEKLKQVGLLQVELEKERLNAERNECAKDYFLVNMSHEIRTPMNAILGFADCLQHSLKDRDDLKSVGMIIRSGETLLATLNDLLDFVSIQTGDLGFSPSVFNLKDTIHAMVLRNESYVKQKKIRINYTIDEDIPESIFGDPARLTQILQNLTSNAIKFTDMGGVLISARLMEDHKDHVIIEFRVHDTGIGIDVDMQETIFNPFEQGVSNMQRKFGGTGIGLSIVKHLTAIQDSEIEVKSQLGEGSEFYFSLSFLKSHAGGHLEEFNSLDSYENDASDFGKDVRVLIVEDNMMNRELVIKLLQKKGYKTFTAENGRLALDKYEYSDYDIILMDLQMPEMDGYETTRHIRNMKSGKKDIPIVAMTAHTIKGEQEKCLSIGMNDFISKPFQAKELYEKVRKLVSASKNTMLK
ncbi:MAG: response regulator [Pedobacter sp.]|uniref:response regulator n=1 Tax=Pedobacter sp. TaxID=1411316 RepID=UPI003566BBE5